MVKTVITSISYHVCHRPLPSMKLELNGIGFGAGMLFAKGGLCCWGEEAYHLGSRLFERTAKN